MYLQTLDRAECPFLYSANSLGTILPSHKSSSKPVSGGLHEKTAGRILALDLGTRRTGVAVSDELQITVRPLPSLHLTNWKELLRAVAELVRRFDAKSLVIGLPLSLDGSEGEAAQLALRRAHNFELSLRIPVYLQDERLTSREAEELLRDEGHSVEEIHRKVDSQSAALILRDFLAAH